MTGSAVKADIAEQPSAVANALADNIDQLGRARELLGSASLIRVLGIGSSRHAGGYAATCFESLAGWPAVVSDAPGMGVPRPPWRRTDAVVALSQSGRTPALVEAVSEARERGAGVVAVVNGEPSPLSELADVTLSCRAGEERVIAATKTVTTQMALARALAAPLDSTEAGRLVSCLGAAVATGVAPICTPPLPGAVVAGGFAGGWLADEVAVKFAEIAGRSTGAEPLVEYLHGPVAAEVPVLALVDADDPNLAGLPAERLIRAGTDPGADVVVPTTGDPTLDVLTRLVVAQRLVVAWAENSGEDPDSPRGLKKVTATR